MDCSKVGKLLTYLRKERGMTQKEVADILSLSDKTISKWERGLGCPDISLLNELSTLFGVNIEKILIGDLNPNDADGGNMKRIKFYVCPSCGNVMTATGEADISCCGRKLEALKAQKQDKKHTMLLEEIEDDYYITFSHEMRKEHFISFVAYVRYDRVLLVKLYPEQNAEVRIPQMRGGQFYAYCTCDGLWAF
ncbi:XRE family transcriptional regulator [Sporanaerobium hydrogeniformans]|uniref:XRE family transcriptional regulator n=1 Tax=Sporanaerobium hydrogeniformans TaxID=3072179 RepID=A0AC61DF26_9FIRM|nr:helix-turn-helix domain-containing protein [Sporanaerobium hydrogeniformans]PHV71791.1 XRE family transcriptional regulator [Sporanaerobium hydrogeniformans]